MSPVLGGITSGYIPGYPNNYGYRASKAALNVVNAALAVDLKSDSVAMVALHAGYAAIDMTGYAKGTISVDTSVDGHIFVITNTTLEVTGKYISYDGTTIPW